MPSTFRLSALADIANLAASKPSSRLLPRLNADGFSWYDFAIDTNGALREVIDDSSSLVFHLEIQKVTGIPITIDENIRKNIKARLIRVCLFEDSQPVSNVHTCICRWDQDEEDVWKFDLNIPLDWNRC